MYYYCVFEQNYFGQNYCLQFQTILYPVILLVKQSIKAMSLQDCQNNIKPRKKQAYAQIRLKFGENVQSAKKELSKQADQNGVYCPLQKIQLADQNSEIYRKFSKASARQSFNSKKERYRRSVYKSKQDGEKSDSYVFISPIKGQRLSVSEEASFSENSAVYKRMSVIERQQNNSTQLIKKAFEEKKQKVIKPTSKQKYRKSRSSRKSINPRYSIDSNTSELFSKWINKNLSIDSDSYVFDSSIGYESQQNLNPQSNAIDTSFSMQSLSKYSQCSQSMTQKINKGSTIFAEYHQQNDYSNIQQAGSIQQNQQYKINDEQQEDLQMIFFGKRQNQPINKNRQNFVQHWQQKSVFIQKKLCIIKQDTHQNDSVSSLSEQQCKRPRIKSEILYPSKKNIQYHLQQQFDRNFQKKNTNKRGQFEENDMVKNEVLKKQIQRVRQAQQCKIEKQAKRQQNLQQPECMIM